MKSKLSFKEAYFLCTHNVSTRKAEEIVGLNHRSIAYMYSKYGLTHLSNNRKMPNYRFEKIDTKEKAYALGFILADSSIDDKYNVNIQVSIRDKEVLDFIASVINSKIIDDRTYNKKSRIFPHSATSKRIKDITKFTGGTKKDTRHYPRICKDLEPYLLQGFFDGDGCITWGYRKDRNRLWHKVSFTSSFSLLEGLQQYLFKQGITTKVKPKAKENCGVLEFANKRDVIKFYNLVYSDKDFIILRRKYTKYNALRLELEENGEGSEKLR